MIIKLECSGGLTGLRICTEIDAKDLPHKLLNTTKKSC